MRVVKEPNTTARCKCCGAEFEDVRIEDTKVGVFGGRYFNCPFCDEEIYTEDLPDLELTPENVSFPANFYHTSDSTAVHVGKKATDRYIKELVTNDWLYTGSGDLFVAYMDGKVIETHDYYETYVHVDGTSRTGKAGIFRETDFPGVSKSIQAAAALMKKQSDISTWYYLGDKFLAIYHNPEDEELMVIYSDKFKITEKEEV